MSNALELIKSIAGYSEKPNYVPWNMNDVEIFYGTPPLLIQGVEYVFARHNFPQRRLVMSLAGGRLGADGVFVSNQNKSGIIEIGILNASASCAGIEALQFLGIPFPMSVVDKATNGLGSATGTACHPVGTPEWRRELFPGLSIYTFATPKLIVLNGMKKLQ